MNSFRTSPAGTPQGTLSSQGGAMPPYPNSTAIAVGRQPISLGPPQMSNRTFTRSEQGSDHRPRIHQTPPPYSRLPMNQLKCGATQRRGATPGVQGTWSSTPASSYSVPVCAVSALPSSYNSESDRESVGHRQQERDNLVLPPKASFSPFSGPLGDPEEPSGDLIDGKSTAPLHVGREISPRHLMPMTKSRRRPKDSANDSASKPKTPTASAVDDAERSESHEPHTEPVAGHEGDEHRLLQRNKQVIFGKVTDGYHNYALQVPAFAREPDDPSHPQTPRIEDKYSKRQWDSITQKWRRALHLWDKPSSGDAETWIQKVCPEDLEDVEQPNMQVSLERLHQYNADVQRCLDRLKASVTKAFGAREGDSSAPEIPRTPNSPSPLLVPSSESIQDLVALHNAQHSLRRRNRAEATASVDSSVDLPQSPRSSSSITLSATTAVPHASAAPNQCHRRPDLSLNLPALEECRAPAEAVSDEDDRPDRVAVQMPSPTKCDASPREGHLAITLLVCPDTQAGPLGQPIQHTIASLSASPSVNDFINVFPPEFPRAACTFHIADPQPLHQSNGCCREESIAAGLHTIDLPSPQPCVLHPGQQCRVIALDTISNVELFLAQRNSRGLPPLYLTSNQSNQYLMAKGSVTPIATDAELALLDFNFQRAHLTPEGIGMLADPRSGILEYNNAASPSPNQQQEGSAPPNRAELTTPVDCGTPTTAGHGL